MNWFLVELQRIARNYQWHYLACHRQCQIDLIAYRVWQQAGCPDERHEEHWWQAEREFYADKPIRGLIVNDPKKALVGQSVSPLQAVVHSQRGDVYPFVEIIRLAGDGLAITASEARAIEEATDAASRESDGDLRRSIEQAVGLRR